MTGWMFVVTVTLFVLLGLVAHFVGHPNHGALFTHHSHPGGGDCTCIEVRCVKMADGSEWDLNDLPAKLIPEDCPVAVPR